MKMAESIWTAREGERAGACRYNLGVKPEEDCGKAASWHVAYAGTGTVVLSCDGHFGNTLRPLVVNGEWLDGEIVIEAIHEARGACLLDAIQPTWWAKDLNICVTEEEGVRLGVLAIEYETAWTCGGCGEKTRVSHHRANSDGSVRHDPFGVNHAPMPGSELAAELQEFYTGAERVRLSQ